MCRWSTPSSARPPKRSPTGRTSTVSRPRPRSGAAAPSATGTRIRAKATWSTWPTSVRPARIWPGREMSACWAEREKETGSMTERAHVTAAQIREQVGHPIVDADGHFMELMPLVDDEMVRYLEQEGGAALRDRFLSSQSQVMDTAVF